MYRAGYLCRKTLGPAGHNEHHEQLGTLSEKLQWHSEETFLRKLKRDAVLYHFLKADTIFINGFQDHSAHEIYSN